MPVVGGDAGPFSSIQSRGSARFVNDVGFGVRQSCSFLLPEKEDAEAWHERCELVGDVLQYLRTFFKGVQ